MLWFHKNVLTVATATFPGILLIFLVLFKYQRFRYEKGFEAISNVKMPAFFLTLTLFNGLFCSKIIKLPGLLMVGTLTLNQVILVRIQARQHFGKLSASYLCGMFIY